MKLARIACSVGLAALLAQTAQAQTTGAFRFLAGSGVGAFGVSVGTYKAQLDGANIDVWCVDFLNHVSVGNQYNVYKTSLGGNPDLSKTRFGHLSNQPDLYRQAAWLAWQFSNSNVPKSSASWGALQGAIWYLMTPGVPYVSPTSTMGQSIAAWLERAADNYDKYYYDNVYVLSDVRIADWCKTRLEAPWTNCGRQEHIYLDGDLTVTPEPATFGLLAIGMVGIGGAGYLQRQRRKNDRA